MSAEVEFGQSIRRLRKAQGLTLEEASEQAGITRKTWGRVESGHSVRFSSLRAMGTVLGINPIAVAAAINGTEPLAADQPALPQVPNAVPLIGPEVQYPTPWRCAEEREGFRIIVSADDTEAARVGVSKPAVADLIVRLVNEAAARGVTR